MRYVKQNITFGIFGSFCAFINFAANFSIISFNLCRILQFVKETVLLNCRQKIYVYLLQLSFLPYLFQSDRNCNKLLIVKVNFISLRTSANLKLLRVFDSFIASICFDIYHDICQTNIIFDINGSFCVFYNLCCQYFNYLFNFVPQFTICQKIQGFLTAVKNFNCLKSLSVCNQYYRKSDLILKQLEQICAF